MPAAIPARATSSDGWTPCATPLASPALEIVFHLGRPDPGGGTSPRGNPLASWSTNVMGTANVLEACRRAPSVRRSSWPPRTGVRQPEWHWGYRENDLLGGHDPTAPPSATTEIVVESYRKPFWHDGCARRTAGLGPRRQRHRRRRLGGEPPDPRPYPLAVPRPAAGNPLAPDHPPLAARAGMPVGYLLLGSACSAASRPRPTPGIPAPPSRTTARCPTCSPCSSRTGPSWPGRPSSPRRPARGRPAHARLHQRRATAGWRPAPQLDEGLHALTARRYRHHHEDRPGRDPRAIAGVPGKGRRGRLLLIEP